MNAPALVDVLIPVYNGARWLEPSLRSMLGQTHAALCIHVVDDGSTDDTPAILARFAAADARLRVHRQANRGIVGALGHGLSFCSAEWLARHDADDVADPTRIEIQLRYLQQHADCVAVGALARHVDADGRALGSITELRPPALADAAWLPAREPYLMHPFLMTRRASLLAVGAYRPVPNAEDSDLYWRLRERGRLHNLDLLLGDYRLHHGSVSSASVAGGRTMAVGSQLAALSACRRGAGSPDLHFDEARAARLRGAASLHDKIVCATAELAVGERARFAFAAAVKLLELADYQPWELARDDCVTVGALLRQRGAVAMARANRRAIARLAARAAVRLWRSGRRRDAALLLDTGLRVEFALRYATESWLPAGARRWLHAARRPRAAVTAP